MKNNKGRTYIHGISRGSLLHEKGHLERMGKGVPGRRNSKHKGLQIGLAVLHRMQWREGASMVISGSCSEPGER